MIVGGLEGAMLVARPYGDTERFQAAAGHLLSSLTCPPASLTPDGVSPGPVGTGV